MAWKVCRALCEYLWSTRAWRMEQREGGRRWGLEPKGTGTPVEITYIQEEPRTSCPGIPNIPYPVTHCTVLRKNLPRGPGLQWAVASTQP